MRHVKYKALHGAAEGKTSKHMDYIMNNLSFRRSNQVDIDLDDLANWDDLPHSRSATPLSSGESEPNNMEVQDSGSVHYDTPVTLRSDNMSPSPLLLPDNASAPPPPTLLLTTSLSTIPHVKQTTCLSMQVLGQVTLLPTLSCFPSPISSPNYCHQSS